jgi:hypothetical protein
MAVPEPFCYRFRDVALTVVNRPYGRKQFAPQHIHVKVTLRAEGQGPPDAAFIIQCADDNETCFRYFLSERAEDLFSANDRQIPVQERDIGPKVPELLDRLPAITSLAHDHHVRLRIDDGGDPFPHPCVIVDKEHSDFSFVRHE